jgi:hypothetical protein
MKISQRVLLTYSAVLSTIFAIVDADRGEI